MESRWLGGKGTVMQLHWITDEENKKDYYAYDEVFDDIPSTFTIRETSEYMDVAEITIRRWAKEGKLPFQKVGKNYVFLVDDLRKLKRKMSRKSIKG